MGYDLIDFYKDENFKELFEDLSIKEQINTNYIDLSEQEKVSDRKEAIKIMECITDKMKYNE